jgi:hypothetical protein
MWTTKAILECNWLQVMEGEVDSSHLSFLHREWGEYEVDTRQDLFKADTTPTYEIEETDFGLRLVALRDNGDGNQYVRVSSFVMPATAWISGRGTKSPHIYTPIDDHHVWRFDLVMLDRPATPEDGLRRFEIGPDFRKIRNRDNDYLQDRESQRRGDFTGIQDFMNEDAVATESMGPIYDRSREHLGMSDRGVIALRKYLLAKLASFEDGAEPPHRVTDAARNDMSHVDTLAELIPMGQHWRDAFPHLTLEAKG